MTTTTTPSQRHATDEWHVSPRSTATVTNPYVNAGGGGGGGGGGVGRGREEAHREGGQSSIGHAHPMVRVGRRLKRNLPRQSTELNTISGPSAGVASQSATRRSASRASPLVSANDVDALVRFLRSERNLAVHMIANQIGLSKDLVFETVKKMWPILLDAQNQTSQRFFTPLEETHMVEGRPGVSNFGILFRVFQTLTGTTMDTVDNIVRTLKDSAQGSLPFTVLTKPLPDNQPHIPGVHVVDKITVVSALASLYKLPTPGERQGASLNPFTLQPKTDFEKKVQKIYDVLSGFVL